MRDIKFRVFNKEENKIPCYVDCNITTDPQSCAIRRRRQGDCYKIGETIHHTCGKGKLK